MKSMIASALFLVAASAHAENFFCKESSKDAIEQRRLQYAVSIVEKSKITDPRVVGQYDYAKNVIVTTWSRNPNSSQQFAKIRSFAAVAKSADVSYFIDAKKTEGVSVGIYLDELDQTTVTLKGLKKSLQMTCTGNDHN